MKTVVTLGIVAMLSGCVVAPAYRVQPVQVQPVAVQPQVIVYPQYESAYIWDSSTISFYFWSGGRRHYMPHGWEYRSYGAPRGYYRHH